jgi:hypothetical protein
MMATQTPATNAAVYQTITGGRIPLSNLSDEEYRFLEVVAKKYGSRQDWTRFAAWWNANFNAAGLNTSSVIYRICQDLEARLGIDQGKVSLPDYRDFLAELIDTHFGSRQEFCKATEVDPGQLSRVLANRGDLSMRVLQQVLEVLHAKLVIQTEEESRAQTSIDRATQAIAAAIPSLNRRSEGYQGVEPPTCPVSVSAEDVKNWGMNLQPPTSSPPLESTK